MSAINPAENAVRLLAEAKLLESYQPSPNAYDELTGGSGQVRPRWQRVLEAFAAMGGEATQAAQDKAQRLMVENDVTFAAQGDRDTSRPWRLDLFPLLIEPDEWSAIERGVVQRTLLLNRLLVDLYGAQRVLKDRLLPPGLVFGNTQFLRPCTSIARPRRSASALRRVRSRALGRRPLVGRQRSHASAVGRRLRAREPRRLVAVLAGAVRGAQRAPPRELLPRVLRAVLELVRPRPAASRVPVAGPVEAELLRARVSRALLGLQRRRRLGSHRARRSRLFEDGRGAQARRPHHAPHRLRALRSARAAHGLADRRAGPLQAARAGKVTIGNALGSGPRRERLVLELPAEL